MGLGDWWRSRSEIRRRRSEQDDALDDLDHVGTDYRPAAGWTGATYRAPDPYGALEEADADAEPEPRRRRRRRRQQRPQEPLTPDDHGPPGRGDRPGRGRRVLPAPTVPAGDGPDASSPAGRHRSGSAAPGERSSEPAAASSRAPRWYVVVPLVVVLALLGARLAVGGVGGGSTSGLEVRWTLEGEDFLPGGTASLARADGTADGAVLVTETGWVVVADDGSDGSSLDPDPDAVVALVDPATGSVRWDHRLPGARCTLLAEELVCLGDTDGTGGTDLVRLDLATGDEVEVVPTDVGGDVLVVQPLGDGLVAVDLDGEVVHLGPDGQTRWSEPARLPDWDPTSADPVAAPYPDAVWVRVGLIGDTLAVTADGVALRVDCDLLATPPEGVLCSDDSGTTGYTALGQERWTQDFSGPRLVDRYQRLAPLAIGSDMSGRLGPVDPLTGDLSVQGRLDDPDDQPRTLLGDTEHPVVLTETTVTLLRPGGAGKVWEVDLDDEYLTIAGGGVLDGVVVVDGANITGLDVATGERLWQRDSPGGDVDVVDGALLGRGYDDLTVYELP